MGEDDFVICRGVFFAGDPFDYRGHGALRFCWIGACHLERKDGEKVVRLAAVGWVHPNLARSAIGGTPKGTRGPRPALRFLGHFVCRLHVNSG